MASLAYIAVGAILGVLRPAFIRKLERYSPAALDILLSLLLFSSSLTFGGDPKVTASLSTLGIASVLTAFFTMSASAAVSVAWHRLVGRNLALTKKAPPERGPVEESQAEAAASMDESETSAQSASNLWAGIASALPALAVIGGWAVGMAFHVDPPAAAKAVALAQTSSSFSLSALLAVVGYDLGKERIWVRLREYGLLAATLPLAVGAASILGAGLAAVIVSMPPTSGFTAGAAFGWYSLAGAVTLSQKGAEAGAYVFLSNLIREVVAVLVVPLLSNRTVPEVAASLGGATSMDSTLPVISRTFGSDGAAWGLITGTVLSLLCPFVLGFFLGL